MSVIAKLDFYLAPLILCARVSLTMKRKANGWFGYLWGNDAFLSRVTEFQLNRISQTGKDGRITVSVHELLTSDRKGKFVATPKLLISESKEEYLGFGDSLKKRQRLPLKN